MRILIVEDYEPLRTSLTKGLREAGYAVDATGDGNEGLWHASDTAYDLIILDIMLPGLDGLSLLRRLRAAKNACHVLILTARDGVEDRIAGLDLGADDYLIKPFVFNELLARVRALVRRAYQNKTPSVTIGPLQLDTTSRAVRLRGGAVELTAREYAVLEYLALRVDQVVSRSELWEHLYEFASEASSNVVDVYIGYLRRKLDTDGQPSLIQTRRGQGYVLTVEP